jgi:hypothetical protein
MTPVPGAVRAGQQERLRGNPATDGSKSASMIRASSRRLSYASSRDIDEDQYQPE